MISDTASESASTNAQSLQPPPKKNYLRRPHKKSHLGCQNCKQKRIKCDENLPCCDNCKRSNSSLCSYLSYTDDQAKEHRKLQQIARQGSVAKDSYGNLKQASKSIPDGARKRKYSTPSEYVFSAGMLPLKPDASSIPSPPTYPSPVSPPLSSEPSRPPVKANLQLTPPPTDKYCSYYLPPIGHHHKFLPRQPAAGPITPLPLPSLPRLPLLEKRRRIEPERPKDVSALIPRQEAFSAWLRSILVLSLDYPCLHHALQAFSLGMLSKCTENPEIQTRADKHRFIALHEIQQEVTGAFQINREKLVSACLVLSWDVFLQEPRYEAYVGMAKGVKAVLDKVKLGELGWETGYYLRESYTLALSSLKYPPYPRESLLAEINEMLTLHLALEHHDIPEFLFLLKYISRVNVHLKAPLASRLTDPSSCFELLRDWVTKFPSIAHRIQPRSLINEYYISLNSVLDALMPEMRYLFQFSFSGPSIDAKDMTVLADYAESIDERKAYPRRLRLYFEARQSRLLELVNCDTRSEQISEKFIKTFKNEINNMEHYLPVLEPRIEDSSRDVNILIEEYISKRMEYLNNPV